MRIFFFISILTFASTLYAQTRPNIDTITLSGLGPGIAGDRVKYYVNEKLDTLFWDAKSGTGLVKYAGTYFDIKGEYRIAYDKGIVSQVLFTAPVKSAAESKPMFDRIAGICKNMYADPDIDYYNVQREIRWDGMERSVMVQTQDNSTYVTVVVRKFDVKRK